MSVYFPVVKDPYEWMPRDLREATQRLMLERVEAERAALLEDALARYRERAVMSLQNALARRYQRRIEGGANVFRRVGVSPEGVERWEGAWREGIAQPPYQLPDGRWVRGRTREEELAEVPEAAWYAYDRYMGIDPKIGLELRRNRALERAGMAKALELERKHRETKELKREEMGLKHEEMRQRRLEAEETRMQKLYRDYLNEANRSRDAWEVRIGKAEAEGDFEAVARLEESALASLRNIKRAGESLGLVFSPDDFPELEEEDYFPEEETTIAPGDVVSVIRAIQDRQRREGLRVETEQEIRSKLTEMGVLGMER
ncbi:MAG: hypothetical protein DDT19_02076 [Syntrophomonadaceae bacterium]|nr:hypothetical protein [Bacillota bacterium]